MSSAHYSSFLTMSRRALRLLAIASALASLGSIVACVRYTDGAVQRVVGGERRRGPWVPPSGYEHFVRAEIAAERGELRAAIEEYELARSGVTDAYLLAREADAAARFGDAGLAERLIDEGLAGDPSSEPLWLLRGRLASERGDLDAAEQALRNAREAAPDDAAPVLLLADLLARRERDDEAMALLDAFVVARPLDVGALRVLLARALVQGDARRASLAALRLLRASPVHRAEVITAIEQALASGHAPLAHAILRALPPTPAETELRFRAALAVHDRDECERLAERADDGSVAGRLRSAEHWLALGDGPRAEEVARSVLLELGRDASPDPRAQRIVSHALILQRRFAPAAELLASMPTGTSEEPARRALLREAIAGAGLPALGREAIR